MQEELGIQLADCFGIGKGDYLSAQPQRQGCVAFVATGHGAGTIMVIDGHGLSLAELRH